MRLLALMIMVTFLNNNTVYAKESDKPTVIDWDFIGAPVFRKIESFGIINVVIVGEQSSKFGLKREKFNAYLQSIFKDNFTDIPYDDVSYMSLEKLDKSKGLHTIGSILVDIWIVGDSYPIVYHLKLRAGSMDMMTVYEQECLGYGNPTDVPDLIRKWIEKEIKELAYLFFKARH